MLQMKTFIIAEVGQNHQGDLNLARQYIKIFAQEGADAVKFQTRDNKKLFSKANSASAADKFNVAGKLLK